MVYYPEEGDEDLRTVYCGNLSDNVTQTLLFELFNQAGPVESVRRPKNPSGQLRSFAFIIYKNECSVPYAVEVFKFTKLFNKALILKTRSKLLLNPVLDTHLTEFTDFENYNNNDCKSSREKNIRDSQKSEYRQRSERHYRDEGSSHRQQLRREMPQSWTEFKSPTTNVVPIMPDFNVLLQMGQQMMFPGMVGMMPMMGLGPSLGEAYNMFSSMQGRLNGGEHNFPSRSRDWRDHSGRESRRHHPYNDRRRNDHQEDHERSSGNQPRTSGSRY